MPAPMSATVVSPLHDELRERRVEGGVADPVGKQRAVVLDAHAKREW